MTKDRTLVLIAFYAALTAALGVIPPIYLPFAAGVPISAQTLGVMLAGIMLGPWRGTLAMLLVILAVAIGLPVLSGGRGGLAVFEGPTVGFLIGWPFGACAAGMIMRATRAWPVLPAAMLASAIGGIAVVYAFGIPLLAAIANLPLPKAAAVSAVYIPGDLVKMAIAAVVAQTVARGMPSALLTRG